MPGEYLIFDCCTRSGCTCGRAEVRLTGWWHRPDDRSGTARSLALIIMESSRVLTRALMSTMLLSATMSRPYVPGRRAGKYTSTPPTDLSSRVTAAHSPSDAAGDRGDDAADGDLRAVRRCAFEQRGDEVVCRWAMACSTPASGCPKRRARSISRSRAGLCCVPFLVRAP